MLFDEIVYGPIHSRRLGVSLGVNLMPSDAKLCSFDCVYCECGFNKPVSHPHLPTPQEFSEALEQKLLELAEQQVVPDVITFSGNGEPTMHPEFSRMVECCRVLRDRYCPTAKISVLSNSTQLFRQDVRKALMTVDNRILKLDSAIDRTMRLIDRPVNDKLTVKDITDNLKLFNGDFILQTCFLKGWYNEEAIDNTSEEELAAWYRVVEELRPQKVMIYVIDRKTPVETLEKISAEKMNEIAEKLRVKGVDVVVSC